MRKTEPMRIGDLVGDFFENHPRLSRLIGESRAADLFRECLDHYALTYLTRIEVKNGILVAYFSSSVIRHEVFMRRTSLLSEINGRLGREILRHVVIK